MMWDAGKHFARIVWNSQDKLESARAKGALRVVRTILILARDMSGC